MNTSTNTQFMLHLHYFRDGDIYKTLLSETFQAKNELNYNIIKGNFNPSSFCYDLYLMRKKQFSEMSII